MKFLHSDGAVRLWAIALLAALFWGGEYWRRDLWEPDEARYAYVAREMRQDGHWLVPHRSGDYYAHKPPLIFWMNNAFAVFNGGEINRVTTRLPTLLGTMLSLWATGCIAAFIFGGSAGWMAPMVLSVTSLFWVVNGMGQIDGLLCGLQMLAFWMLLSATAETGPRRRLRLIMAYLAMGLAVLAKGPVGLLVPFGAWISYCIFSGRHRLLRCAHLLWGPLLALLPVALWLGSIVYFKAAPDGFFNELLFKQNVGRVAGSFAEGHTKPVWYFIVYFLSDFMPWLPLLPVAVVALRRDDGHRAARRGVAAWFLFVLLFFSLSATKRNLYTLMAYPAAAMMLAAGWERIAAAPARLRRVSQRVFAGMLLMAGSALTLAEGVVLVFRLKIPVSLWSTVPGGFVLVLTGWLLLRHSRDTDTQRWFVTAWGGIAGALLLLAFFVYPAVNPIKAPYALATAAQHFLPKNKDLLLYKMQGEIQALYCHARGKVCVTREALVTAIAEQQTGMVVITQRDWDDVCNIPAVASGTRGDYRMGSKKMVWVAFSPPVPGDRAVGAGDRVTDASAETIGRAASPAR